MKSQALKLVFSFATLTASCLATADDFTDAKVAAASGRYDAAHSLYEKAAKAGNAKAMNNLGTLYFQGKGVEKNEKEALSWFMKAAAQGVPESETNIGEMYKHGLGVEKDRAKALSWFMKAASKGLAKAQYLAYAELFNMEPPDHKRALPLLQKAVAQGYGDAIFDLAVAYNVGSMGLQRDSLKAYTLFMVARRSEYRSIYAFMVELDDMRAALTPDQLAEAERLIAAWKPGK